MVALATLASSRSARASTSLEELRTPCLIAYKNVIQRNVDSMQERAKRLGCELRAHVKTVKTVEGAAIVTGGTRRGIVCSTLAEVEFFAAAGFDDIVYAVPLTPDKIPDILRLNDELTSFHVLVDHPAHVDALAALGASPPSTTTKPVSVYVGVDCGYHRDGVDPDDPESVDLVRALCESPLTSFAGLYTHGGHSYDTAGDASALRAIAEAERDITVGFANKLRAAGVTTRPFRVGVGSTPTCSRPPAHLDGVDEMHPGNFIYYDMTQVGLGACTVDDIAVRVLTRVVGHYRKSNTLLIDCGWTGASAQGKEQGYGFFPRAPELQIANLKQECGEVTTVDGAPIDFERYPIGSLLALAPWHSCASTHQHAHVHVLEDEAAHEVAEVWAICKGW